MMKTKSIFYIGCTIFSILLLFTSCKYDTEIAHPEKFVKIYMPQAVENPISYDFVMADTNQTIIYGANYGGVDYPKEDITVYFEMDKSLVDSFNLKHNTSYPPMPDGSFSLESESTIIPKGKVSTQPLSLYIKTKDVLQPYVRYLLPLRVKSANGNIPISSDLGSTYFLIQGFNPVSSPDTLKNTEIPFQTSSRDGRWGTLADWTTTEPIKNHNGYGGFDGNNEDIFAVEAGWGSPGITNGKIYQTLDLPAGTYTFKAHVRAVNIKKEDIGGAYVVVSEGDTLPDVDGLENSTLTLGYKQILNTTTGDYLTIKFTISKQKQVSVGIVATLAGGTPGKFFRIDEFEELFQK